MAILPQPKAPDTDEELARKKYLALVDRAERNKAAQQPAKGYDEAEFQDDTLSDLYE
jgi:hypothetical protein